MVVKSYDNCTPEGGGMFTRTKKWLGKPVYRGDLPSNGLMLGALVFSALWDYVWGWVVV